MSVVCISGGFDPIHIGHLNLIDGASQYGDVIVILNSDEWLKRKKGYCFMPYEQRARMLYAVKGVIDVVPVDDTDRTVCEALKRIKPNYFANGGDRTAENTPELAVCTDYGIKPLWGIGGGKVASSSELIKTANSQITCIDANGNMKELYKKPWEND